MNITITRRERRVLLRCTRLGGSSTAVDLGAALPHHDLAHYVVERNLRLKGGFFGRIAEGYSVDQLADKHVIKTLGADTWIAEVVTRALQSLSSGACTPADFAELVNAELTQGNIPVIDFQPGTVSEMLTEFETLIDRYRALEDGGCLELDFAV